MKQISVIFFGSFQHYSTIILAALHNAPDIDVRAVVSTPSPQRTHTHLWAQEHKIQVFTPNVLDETNLKSADFFVVAGYRMLLPPSWLKLPRIAPLNIHPSLLPAYPGPAPVEWALLKGEKTTGVTIIKMTEEYDQGPIIDQQKLSIRSTDNRLTLYQRLYELGAAMITKNLKPPSQIPQPKLTPTPYARKWSREDGFIPWLEAHAYLTDRPSAAIDRKLRAFYGYPGVWTQIKTAKGTKNLKILSPTQVQMEGYQASTFNQIKNQIIP